MRLHCPVVLVSTLEAPGMRRLWILLLLAAISGQLWSRPLDYPVPDGLEAWIPWVLEGDDVRPCPVDLGTEDRLCAWPGRLDLELGEDGGLFAQRWRLYAPSWVPLPGGTEGWPQDVRAGDDSVAVTSRGGRPTVRLPPGDHVISGRFVWPRVPEGLPVPPETALLALRLDGQKVAFPRLEADGRLWLTSAPQGLEGAREALGLDVQRLVEDDNPLRVVTRLELRVAGVAREVTLGPVLLEGAVPLALDSPLPVKLEPGGRLRVQLRPGRWVLEVVAYQPGPVGALTRPPAPVPWPDSEAWAFSARPELRRVVVSGSPAVDPRQTGLPAEWARLPAYLVGAGGSLLLRELSRGDAGTAPDRLSLERQLWLDFEGGGYTVRDRIAGDLTRSWRLEVEPPLRLGRVEEGGVGRLITRLGKPGREGVEGRPGTLDMTAVARIDGSHRSLPASGWALDFRSMDTRLHLPPGWELLAAGGVDSRPDTWVNRWSLLDLFLVMLIGIGAWRLWGPLWGILALAAMALTWQEPGAPRLVWINLIAAVALLRVTPRQPDGTALARIRRLLELYYRLGLVLLAAVALPFLVDQARLAIYPQLERPGPGVVAVGGREAAQRAPVPAESAPEGALRSGEAVVGEAVRDALPDAATAEDTPVERIAEIDPDAMVQTGPGVPGWTWTPVRLGWSGPVPRDHTIRLWLLPPGGSLVAGFLGIALVLLLGLQLGGLLRIPRRGALPGAAILVAAGWAGGMPGPADAGEFPSRELLADLRARLLEPPECLPACAEIPRMELRARGDWLDLTLTVDVQTAAGVPMPGGKAAWTPAEILLEGQPIEGLLRKDDGTALLALPAGRWRVELAGPLPGRGDIEIPLPLRPRFALAEAPGYEVQGIGEDGRPDAQVRLVQIQRDGSVGAGAEPQETPPLLRVVRTLRLYTDWRVETRVVRLSPPELPLVLPVALISGEQVLDEGVRVEDGRALVSLPSGRTQTGWSSALEPVDRVVLQAGADPRLSETWRLDLGPQWHLELEGIPPVHHQGRLEHWLPTWRPWPGEELRLLLSRPVGVPGPTVTLTESDYRIIPGTRAAAVSLALTLLSSQGGRHGIRLPEGASLEVVRIDGQERPLQPEGAELLIPLVPGSQRVELGWQQPSPITMRFAPPLPDPGLKGVNARLRIDVAPDRWILLTGGPALGPAVLFWGLVLVLVLVSIGLGRSRLTPLRAWDWLLLGLGLSQAGIWAGLLVVLWLFALGLRGRLERDMTPWRYNLMQLALVGLSLAALAALVAAVQQGLLGSPDMQIAGNGSNSGRLVWFQDRSDAELPQVWVLSVPVLFYRGLMLAWALWLAFRLVGWLRWGWRGFARPTPWRETGLRLAARRRSAGEGEG
jgi:hypothetical protein